MVKKLLISCCLVAAMAAGVGSAILVSAQAAATTSVGKAGTTVTTTVPAKGKVPVGRDVIITADARDSGKSKGRGKTKTYVLAYVEQLGAPVSTCKGGGVISASEAIERYGPVVWNQGVSRSRGIFWFKYRIRSRDQFVDYCNGTLRKLNCSNRIRALSFNPPKKRILRGKIIMVRSFSKAQAKARVELPVYVNVVKKCPASETTATVQVWVKVWAEAWSWSKAWAEARAIQAREQARPSAKTRAEAEANARAGVNVVVNVTLKCEAPTVVTTTTPATTTVVTTTAPTTTTVVTTTPANQPPRASIQNTVQMYVREQRPICGEVEDPDRDPVSGLDLTASRGMIDQKVVTELAPYHKRICGRYTAPSTVGSGTDRVTVVGFDRHGARAEASDDFHVEPEP